MPQATTKRRYTIDGLDATVEGWDTGKRWNEWHVPAFERDAVVALAEAMQAADTGERLRWISVAHREHPMVVVHGPSTGDRGHRYPASDLHTPGGTLTTWQVGRCGWCWYPVDEDTGDTSGPGPAPYSEGYGRPLDCRGMRFRLRRPVERFPDFIAPVGTVLTVEDWTPDLVKARAAEPIDGAETCDHRVYWYGGPEQDDARLSFLTDALPY